MKLSIIMNLSVVILLAVLVKEANAKSNYMFSCKDSVINGSITYGVIGTYQFNFKKCSGRIDVDPKTEEIKNVEVLIDLKSLNSNCPRCDKIVLSKKLLDANMFPYIRFESREFFHNKNEQEVLGSINLKGMVKKQQGTFKVDSTQMKHLDIKGNWKINRKRFDIIWNKFLDHGGIVVGDYIKIDWHVVAHRQK